MVRFIKFSIVGGSGVVVDMVVLYLLVERLPFPLPLWSCKTAAALTAMVNNFFINDRWTFQDCHGIHNREHHFARLIRFVLICSVGLGIAVVTLYLLYRSIGMNLYVSNGIAIITAAWWNYSVSSRYAWKPGLDLERRQRVNTGG